MCLSPVRRLRFEKRSFSDNQLFSFSTSNPKELASQSFFGEVFILHLTKFTFWHAALVFYCVICIVVAVKRRCCENTLFSRVQAGKPILQFSFSMLATSKRSVTHPSCTETPHWLPFSLTTFSFSKKFGSLEKV